MGSFGLEHNANVQPSHIKRKAHKLLHKKRQKRKIRVSDDVMYLL
jgi:hypothetical protein